MIEYGILVNGQLIVHKKRREGDKPIVRTAPPKIADDEISWFSFTENDTEIVQIWHVEKNHYDPIEPSDDIDEAEAYNIIFGGGAE